MYRKGTTLLRKRIKHPKHQNLRQVVIPFYRDMISSSFWESNPEILSVETAGVYEWPIDEKLPDLVLPQLHLNDFKTE